MRLHNHLRVLQLAGGRLSGIVVPRWIILVGSLIVLVGLMAFLASLVVGYIGDEYVSPAFSEQSVPPSRSH